MITRNRILFTIGVLTVLIPLSGFPSLYKSSLTIAAGVAVVVMAFLYARARRISQMENGKTQSEVTADVYTESRPTFSLPNEEDDEDDNFTDLNSIRSHSRTVRSF